MSKYDGKLSEITRNYLVFCLNVIRMFIVLSIQEVGRPILYENNGLSFTNF